MPPIRRALISVFDKTGLPEFAQALKNLGVEILSTGGTAVLLKEKGVDVTGLSEYTGFPEMMGGRVKTLHPKVHGGILAVRNDEGHVAAMKENDIQPIDLVVVNLYPFEATVARPDCTLEDAIENIDIGGPAMIRSAAKNYKDVFVITDPSDYDSILKEMTDKECAVSLDLRLKLSRKAYQTTSRYDALISEYLSKQENETNEFPDQAMISLTKVQDLRYGENPHQAAAFYRESNQTERSGLADAKQLQGKELSFNNLLDVHSAWELVLEFEQGAAVVIKHNNPCGVALGDEQLDAFVRAREVDPVSAFGGVLGFNQAVTLKTAQEILKNFVEVIIAPDFDPDAQELFKSKKNIRLLRMSGKTPENTVDYKRVAGGFLLQQKDGVTLDHATLKTVSEKKPDDSTLDSLVFAWKVAKHVKSNAIVYSREKTLVGIGAGQMSRVDSARLGIEKATSPIAGSVMASDAFFPFRDSIDQAAEKGVAAIIQPGGSIRDKEVIDAANEHGIAMVFTGIRHFRH